MNYLNDGLPFLVNCSITEYDIKSGNVSVMSEYNLIPKETIDEIARLPKSERVKRVGILQINNKPFAKSLENGFNLAVQEFIKQNGLDIDVDILAVKKDAVFVINKPILKPRLGPISTLDLRGNIMPIFNWVDMSFTLVRRMEIDIISL